MTFNTNNLIVNHVYRNLFLSLINAIASHGLHVLGETTPEYITSDLLAIFL